MFHSLYTRSQATAAQENPLATARPWPAVYQQGIVSIQPHEWILTISGLVENPGQFTDAELKSWPQVTQNRRLVDVGGWTYRSEWQGVLLEELIRRVNPLPEAQFIHQVNLAGEQECLPLADALSGKALLCHSEAGQPLPPVYGGPWHLLVFDRYSYKGLTQISGLVFSAEPLAGTPQQRGYAAEGYIEPGSYYAMDLQNARPVSGSEEIQQY